jgi:hypothetical protein
MDIHRMPSALRNRSVPQLWLITILGAAASVPAGVVINQFPNSEATVSGAVMIIGATIAGSIAATRTVSPGGVGLRAGSSAASSRSSCRSHRWRRWQPDQHPGSWSSFFPVEQECVSLRPSGGFSVTSRGILQALSPRVDPFRSDWVHIERYCGGRDPGTLSLRGASRGDPASRYRPGSAMTGN